MTAQASLARKAASHFEAKKTGFGQAQDGWSLTLRIQDNDIPAHVRDAKKGTRYMVALVEIGDNEEPVVPRQESVTASAGDKPKRPFAGMPYATQSALRCRDPIFRAFLREMCAATANNPEQAADFVRQHCGVNSRSDIKPDTEAETHWLELEQWFSAWQTKERAMA